MEFHHTPRPPVVLSEKIINHQRWYGANLYSVHSLPLGEPSGSSASVCRLAHEGFASLNFSTSIGYLRFACTPDQLRELARRLIDAAHDIETHPALEQYREAA